MLARLSNILLTKIGRLHLRTHVGHFTDTHFPIAFLQHPNIVATVVDSERLFDVVQSGLIPTRVCDTTIYGKQRSLAKCKD